MLSTFPMDIWRHMLMWRDQELNYRLSVLSKSLYQLAQPYRRQILRAHQVRAVISNAPSQSSPAFMRAFDEFIQRQKLSPVFEQIDYELIPTSETLSQINTFGAIRDTVATKDMAFTRVLSFYPFSYSLEWLVRHKTEIRIFFTGATIINFVLYELFDRKYTVYSDRIGTVDRYSLIITPGVHSDDNIIEDDQNNYAAYIRMTFDSILKCNPNCEIRWDSVKCRAIFTFNLS